MFSIRRIPLYLGMYGLLRWMPDRTYLAVVFRLMVGYPLDLDDPQTFNEKLQWLKLYDHRQEYTTMVDKYAVRKHIADTIGEEYLVPLLGVWDNPDEIDFNALPDQFVLKCNHNSGIGICICKDKSTLNIEKVRKGLRRALKQDYYQTGREWPYKNVPRRIVAEKLLVDDSGFELKDYKVLCFGGKARFIEWHSGRFTPKHTILVFDTNWHLTQIEQSAYCTTDSEVGRPSCLDQMLFLSETLASGYKHVRIDWYIVDNRLLFGEFTFYDGSGFIPYDDYADDLLLGGYIQLD